MSKTFRFSSNVTVPMNGTPTKENYLIDVRVYDDDLDPDFKTIHYDPSFNYVAFVSFSPTKATPNTWWNIGPKIALTLPSDDEWSDVYDRVNQYQGDYGDAIVEAATNYFKSNYPHLA